MSTDLKKVVERCFENVSYGHIESVLYQTQSGDHIEKMYERFQAMPMRSDDVIVLGWPRSGNHWTYFLTTMVLHQTTTPPTKSIVESMPDFWTDEKYQKFVKEPSPRLFCTHARPRRYLNQVVEKKPRIVYIMRNPKDALVSMYKLHSRMNENISFKGSWSDYFDLSIAGENVFGSWFDHVLSIESFMKEHPDVPVYIHSFEDTKLNPVESIRKLCQFLGVPITLAEDIAEATSLEGIKTAVQKQTSTNDIYFKPGETSGFIQTGLIGNWKKMFTVDQNERFNKAFEEKMSGSTLGSKVKKYIF